MVKRALNYVSTQSSIYTNIHPLKFNHSVVTPSHRQKILKKKIEKGKTNSEKVGCYISHSIRFWNISIIFAILMPKDNSLQSFGRSLLSVVQHNINSVRPIQCTVNNKNIVPGRHYFLHDSVLQAKPRFLHAELKYKKINFAEICHYSGLIENSLQSFEHSILSFVQYNSVWPI